MIHGVALRCAGVSIWLMCAGVSIWLWRGRPERSASTSTRHPSGMWRSTLNIDTTSCGRDPSCSPSMALSRRFSSSCLPYLEESKVRCHDLGGYDFRAQGCGGLAAEFGSYCLAWLLQTRVTKCEPTTLKVSGCLGETHARDPNPASLILKPNVSTCTPLHT